MLHNFCLNAAVVVAKYCSVQDLKQYFQENNWEKISVKKRRGSVKLIKKDIVLPYLFLSKF
jgi:hypothetical protein